MYNLILTVVRHLTSVIMAAVSTLLLTLLTGIGLSSGDAGAVVGNVELIVTAALLTGFYALYEKVLKPFFSRFFGELPDLPPPDASV